MTTRALGWLPCIGVLSLFGCGNDGGEVALPPDPVTRLIGELHLHQFPAGAHAWAAFIRTPVPLASVNSDQLVSLDTAATASDGACTLYGAPTCSPACGAGSYCSAADTCSPLTPLTYVDGGEVDITGSRLVPRIRLWFSTQNSTYDSDPAPGASLLFMGGEPLLVVGGRDRFALRGRLTAPRPVVVAQPDLGAALHLPRDRPLDVRWAAEDAGQVVLTLSASARSGSFGLIRCVMPDTGAYTVPATLLSALPPSPRDIRFELERDDEQILKTVQPGVGILAHAGFSTWKNGAE